MNEGDLTVAGSIFEFDSTFAPRFSVDTDALREVSAVLEKSVRNLGITLPGRFDVKRSDDVLVSYNSIDEVLREEKNRKGARVEYMSLRFSENDDSVALRLDRKSGVTLQVKTSRRAEGGALVSAVRVAVRDAMTHHETFHNASQATTPHRCPRVELAPVPRCMSNTCVPRPRAVDRAWGQVGALTSSAANRPVDVAVEHPHQMAMRLAAFVRPLALSDHHTPGCCGG